MRRYVRDDTGGTAAEYALLLAIVGAAIAASALLFSDAVSSAMNRASLVIAGATSPAAETPSVPGRRPSAAARGRGRSPNAGRGNNNGNGNQTPGDGVTR
jgi:pilus assembly protein Flp/PilA